MAETDGNIVSTPCEGSLTGTGSGSTSSSPACSTRRNGLIRELELRARHYPQWIRKGRLTQADATSQTQRLQAMLALYDEGLDFPGTLEDFAPYVADQILALQGDQQKELAL